MDTAKRIRNIWSNMLRRCYNPNSSSYKWYGGKGITVCDEWRHCKAFREWALSSGYKPGLSIERIDNEKGYSPENCKWISLSEQGKNRSNNHFITINGETKILSDWARYFDVKKSALSNRIRRGWNEMDAVLMNRQINPNSQYPILDRMIYEKFKTKKQMAEEIGINEQTLWRITNGSQCPTITEAYLIATALNVPFMRIANIFLGRE